MENQEHYIKGFNNGYLLSKHNPKLLEKLTKNLQPNNDYNEGLLSGRDQYKMEKFKEMAGKLKSSSSSSGV